QERVLVLEMRGNRSASPSAVQALLAAADMLAEAARSDGRLGYRHASEATLALPSGFRPSYYLYRRLGITRFLAARLADRVELLLTTRFVVERLRRFNTDQISGFFGERLAAITREIVDKRRELIAGALDALRRQYPDYLLELEERFLRQSTL